MKLLRNGRFFVFGSRGVCFRVARCTLLGTPLFVFGSRGVCFRVARCLNSHATPKTPPTAEQWAHIVGMLASAHAGLPAAQSACTCGQTEAKRDMSLRTNLYGATQREDHAQPGVGAATPTSSSTACGRCCRGDSAAGPPCSDADLVPHEEPRAFDPEIPDLAGASRRLPAAQQVSAGTSH